MNTELVIRGMLRAEVDVLIDWAAREGWNPGLHDAAIFWAHDPDAFIAAELRGELIGGGAITAYGDEFGFMGFFIVRPEFRGHGYGNALWLARRERLRARLRPGATLGMDGAFEMEPYYARGGFVRSHRDIRYSSEIPSGPIAPASNGEGLVPLRDVDFDDILAYDRTCFPARRETFLRAWVNQQDALALASRREGRVVGYGVVRRCRSGCKIGPLFSDDLATATTLYHGLARFAAGGPLFLDVPENNPAALALAQNQGMKEAFGCARMYLGVPPAIADARVFGVTTFELG